MAVVKRLPAQVASVIEHADDLRTYEMCPAAPLPRFRPGQFLHLALDAYDPAGAWPDSRIFSIANSPRLRDRIRITVSERGAFTRRMGLELAPGSPVWIKLPYGDFTFDDGARSVVLAAGGAGITPFVSFLETAIENASQRRIWLFQGARSPRHLLYTELVDRCIRELPNFYVRRCCESEARGVDRVGRLDIEEIIGLTRGEKPLFYLSGPPDMVESFRLALIGAGVAPADARVDAWE